MYGILWARGRMKQDHSGLQVAQTFLSTATQGIHALLGEQLVAVYLHGSVATGDFVPNKSDLDVIAISQTSLSVSEKEKIGTWFANYAPPQIVQGIDWAVITQQAVAVPSKHPHWDMVIRIQRCNRHFDVLTVDSYEGYSLMDLAVARERGYALTGPEPITAITELPRRWLLETCVAELHRWVSWDVINDRSSAVLTACRSWFYLEKRLLGTKSEAGVWARSQLPRYASLIDTALAQRQGESDQALENQEVKAFCQQVLSYLEDTICASDMEPNE